MAEKIIKNPSITSGDFSFSGDAITAIVGHPIAGAGGGEGATYSAGPNIDITDNIISGKDWTPELNAKLNSTAFTLPTSANWDNTYSTVMANSANWNSDLDTLYSAGPNIDITDNIISGKDWTPELNAKLDSTAFTLPTSANWDNTYSTVNSESANWTKVYDTVTANSANWNNDLDTLYSAGPNINITDNTISGRDWTTEINAKLDTTAFSLPNSATWDDTYNTVNSNSATWNEVNEYTAGQNINITDNVISSKDWSDEINTKLDTTAFSLPNSANWNNTYDTVSANSAQWSNDTTYTAGPNINITDNVISGKDWSDELNSKLDSTAFDSTNWDNTYNTVNSNSAQWSNDTTYTAGSNIDITNNTISSRDWTPELNAKLNSTAFTLSESANWNNTYSTVNSESANWNSVSGLSAKGSSILCQNISYTATGSNINVTVPNNTYATISGLNVSGTINVIISATNVINGSELNSCAGRLMFSTNKPSTLNFVDSSTTSKLPVIGQLPTTYSGTNYQFTCVAGVVACKEIKTIT